MSQTDRIQEQVTQVLARACAGDGRATDELFPIVYDELRRLAAQHLAQEAAGHTLQPTALAHEAYLKLVRPSETSWQSRAHFFGAAARAIRQILIDHARAKAAEKRGGGAERSGGRVELTELPVDSGATEQLDLLALDEALHRLAELDPKKAQLVELRFFGGLSVDQAAEAVGISPRSAAREWEFARVWLFKELSGGESHER